MSAFDPHLFAAVGDFGVLGVLDHRSYLTIYKGGNLSHQQLTRPDVEGGGGEQRTIVQDIELSHGRWRMHPVKLPVNERKDQLFASSVR